MFICSVSTILFNGNPLLRFDGYYILMDLVEIPNLRQKSTEVLKRFMVDWCLGIEQPENPFLPQRRQFLFAIYTIAAVLYRWVVVFSICLLPEQSARTLRPQGAWPGHRPGGILRPGRATALADGPVLLPPRENAQGETTSAHRFVGRGRQPDPGRPLRPPALPRQLRLRSPASRRRVGLRAGPGAAAGRARQARGVGQAGRPAGEPRECRRRAGRGESAGRARPGAGTTGRR